MTLPSLTIAGRLIGATAPPFVVAEMSGNHNQSLERALAIVDAAAAAGAHGLKIQTYTADTMTIDSDRNGFIITDKNSLWSGRKLYDLYREAHTPWEWHRPIFERAQQRGLIAFSTPFDESAVDFLETLDVPCYKIASFENTDIPLLRKVATTGKPVIMSTGMASVSELGEAVEVLRHSGCRDLVLLKCTSAYPAPFDSINLNTLPHLRELFACQVGLSDHTPGTCIAAAAVALGACLIEKHFTLSRTDGGVDAAFSLEPAELRRLTEDSENTWRALGRVAYGLAADEEQSRMFRRSLYAACDIRAGEPLTTAHLSILRPCLGLAPKYLDLLLGKCPGKNIHKGTPITWDLLL